MRGGLRKGCGARISHIAILLGFFGGTIGAMVLGANENGGAKMCGIAEVLQVIGAVTLLLAYGLLINAVINMFLDQCDRSNKK
jgi:hypothetical protein